MDTPEELVKEAIARGFDSLGFSAHSYVDCKATGLITLEELRQYNEEVSHLKEKYRGVIDIYRGIEYDLYSDQDYAGYEYTIASIHYLKTTLGRRCIDFTMEDTDDLIRECYGGDAMKYAKAYYEALSSIGDVGKFDILGHMDIVTKYNEGSRLFDTSSKEYRNYAISAIDALVGKIPIFEVNTGVVARGYKSEPYPSLDLMRELYRRGFKVAITSDCHNKNQLDFYFDKASQMLKEAGFKSKVQLTPTGFVEVEL